MAPSPLFYDFESTALQTHYFEVIVFEMVGGVPRRRSNWTPTVPLVDNAPYWKMPARRGAFMLTDREVTIAADGFEVHVLDGRYEGMTASPPNVKKIYTVLKPLDSCEVDEWMHHNLPHYVAYNKRERVDKAAERRWLNQHATGLWSLAPIDGGVRFAAESDAFWFKMSRT
jgi:hypothetical protein